MSLEKLSEETKKRMFEILSKVTEGIKKLPKSELPIEPDEFTDYMNKILPLEDAKYLVEIGTSLDFTERNYVMKTVLEQSGRYVIREYDCDIDGKKERTFALYVAEQA
jgi:hypothetical protein